MYVHPYIHPSESGIKEMLPIRAFLPNDFSCKQPLKVLQTVQYHVTLLLGLSSPHSAQSVDKRATKEKAGECSQPKMQPITAFRMYTHVGTRVSNCRCLSSECVCIRAYLFTNAHLKLSCAHTLQQP